MAKSRFVQNVRNSIPLKKISTNFIFLALLFIASVLMFFIFNKYGLENLDNNSTQEYDNNATEGYGDNTTEEYDNNTTEGYGDNTTIEGWGGTFC